MDKYKEEEWRWDCKSGMNETLDLDGLLPFFRGEHFLMAIDQGNVDGLGEPIVTMVPTVGPI